jgi:hypothetical protein
MDPEQPKLANPVKPSMVEALALHVDRTISLESWGRLWLCDTAGQKEEKRILFFRVASRLLPRE